MSTLPLNPFKAIGERIKLLRIQHGLTQEELASAIKQKPLKVSQIERASSKQGKPYVLKVDVLIELCKLFKVSADYILFKAKIDFDLVKKIDLLSLENSQLKKEIVALKDHIKTLKKVKGL